MNSLPKALGWWFLPVLAVGMFAPVASAKSTQYLVYVGTYTGGKSQGIYAFRFNAKDGRAEQPFLAAATANPTFLTLSPDRSHLYAVGELGTFQGKKAGAVSAFAIDRASGKLQMLNQVGSGGSGPCHLAIDATGKWVLVANYGGGSVASFPVKPDGSVGEAASFHQHQGSSVNPRRQEGPHAHGVTFDAANRFVVVPDLGLDRLMVYRFDAATGQLTPNDPPSTPVKPGSGPRHFTFAPNGKYGFGINEMASTIVAYSYDGQKGTLQELQTVSTLPDGFGGESTTAEIEVHPSGRFLYGSNRGHDSIAAFAVNRSRATLKPIGITATQGKFPRNFAIDPTGDWLWAGNQNSDSLVLFRIEPKTGLPLTTGSTLTIGSPVCVRYLPVD